MPVTIESYIDISIEHITEKDNLILNKISGKDDYPVFDTDFGYILLVTKDEIIEDKSHYKAIGLSNAFCNILDLAIESMVSMIKIDCDADTIEGLDTFDWLY